MSAGDDLAGRAGACDFGRVASVSAIAARLQARKPVLDLDPYWDKRPGALEATRGAGPPVAVGARTQGDDWTVTLLRGGALLARLSPAEARALAEQLIGMADVVERKW